MATSIRLSDNSVPRRAFSVDSLATTDEIVAGFELDRLANSGPTNRPYVVLNMVSTVDGHATLRGRSGPLSSPADRELFHGLRMAVDAVMAGAGTVPEPSLERLIHEIPSAIS